MSFAAQVTDILIPQISLAVIFLLSTTLTLSGSGVSADRNQCSLLDFNMDTRLDDDITASPVNVIMSNRRHLVQGNHGVLLPKSPISLTPLHQPFVRRLRARRYVPEEENPHHHRHHQQQQQQQQHPDNSNFYGQFSPGAGGHMPWSCEGAAYWRDLGQDHQPRYVREVNCEEKYCWFGHFKCKPKRFTVQVLQRISYIPPGCPTSLYGKWRPKNVDITLYCECGH